MARTKDAVLAPEQKELMEKEYLDFVKPSTYGNKANPSSCNSLYDDVERITTTWVGFVAIRRWFNKIQILFSHQLLLPRSQDCIFCFCHNLHCLNC